jgi:hypothetical protein
LEAGVDISGASLPTKVASDWGRVFLHFPHAAALGEFSALQ